MLSGKTADAAADIGLAIPFTRDASSRLAAAELLAELVRQLDGAIAPEHLTPLAAKLLAHLTKVGAQTPAAIQAFPATTLAAAIREGPDLLVGKPSIAAFLRAHAQRSHQAAAHFTKVLPATKLPRLVLWSDGRQRLEEATLHGVRLCANPRPR